MKVVSCAVHKQIELPDVLFSIMNTEQLERLRHIKQLGVVDRVFPTAEHTRFQHSVGSLLPPSPPPSLAYIPSFTSASKKAFIITPIPAGRTGGFYMF